MRLAEGQFSLTPRVLSLGMAFVASLGLWEVGRPHLERLVAQTGESSSMSQLDGSDIVYVARVAVPKLITLRVEIGTRFPAPYTSQGKVLLAALGPDELAACWPSRAARGCPVFCPVTRRRSARSCAPSGPGAGRWPTRNWRRASGRSRRRSGTAREPCGRP